MMYGLFRCNLCGREELKRLPIYDDLLFHTIRCACGVIPETEIWGYGKMKCMGEMTLDTRYNFHGCLQGSYFFINGALGYSDKRTITWSIPRSVYLGLHEFQSLRRG